MPTFVPTFDAKCYAKFLLLPSCCLLVMPSVDAKFFAYCSCLLVMPTLKSIDEVLTVAPTDELPIIGLTGAKFWCLLLVLTDELLTGVILCQLMFCQL